MLFWHRPLFYNVCQIYQRTITPKGVSVMKWLRSTKIWRWLELRLLRSAGFVRITGMPGNWKDQGYNERCWVPYHDNVARLPAWFFQDWDMDIWWLRFPEKSERFVRFVLWIVASNGKTGGDQGLWELKDGIFKLFKLDDLKTRFKSPYHEFT